MCAAALAGCTPTASAALEAAPAPVVSAKPSSAEPAQLEEETEPNAPQLRTGRIQPVEHAELLELKVRRHAVDGDEQLLELVLPEFAAEAPGDLFWLGTEARITGSVAPLQLVSRGKGSEMLLWLRRPKSEAVGEIMGDAYTPAVGAQPGHHFRFRAAAPSGGVSPELASLWAGAAAEYLASRGGTFGMSAARRLHTRYKLTSELSRTWSDRASPAELVDLMDTFAGRSAVQAAIAIRRGAVLSAASSHAACRSRK